MPVLRICPDHRRESWVFCELGDKATPLRLSRFSANSVFSVADCLFPGSRRAISGNMGGCFSKETAATAAVIHSGRWLCLVIDYVALQAAQQTDDFIFFLGRYLELVESLDGVLRQGIELGLGQHHAGVS